MINLDNLDLSTHPREKIMADTFSFLVRRAQAQFGNVEPDPRHPLEPSRHFSDTFQTLLTSTYILQIWNIMKGWKMLGTMDNRDHYSQT